ncbi:hypothetical protein KQI91_10615 [Blautia sp. MSJ-19]|nr:hypothetical protein [Blautia sp. MSJ-19]
MYSEVLAQRVSELKESEKGSDNMCEALEKLIQEGEARGELRGIAEGERKKAKEIAKRLSQKGMSVAKIAQILKEDDENVESWLMEK